MELECEHEEGSKREHIRVSEEKLDSNPNKQAEEVNPTQPESELKYMDEQAHKELRG